jgi:hypothetical protein
VTVVTNARAFYHYTRGCGRIGRPAFPAPSDVGGQDVPAKLAWLRGEIAKPCLLNALFEHRIRGKAFGFQPLPNGIKRLRISPATTYEIKVLAGKLWPPRH